MTAAACATWKTHCGLARRRRLAPHRPADRRLLARQAPAHPLSGPRARARPLRARLPPAEHPDRRQISEGRNAVAGAAVVGAAVVGAAIAAIVMMAAALVPPACASR